MIDLMGSAPYCPGGSGRSLLLQRSPRTLWRLRAAFTVIELVIVLVIVALLAAIAVPQFTKSKQRQYAEAMEGDLRRLAAAESSYFHAHKRYTTDKRALSFSESPGVTVTIGTATDTGWSARASSSATAVTCSISIDPSSRSNMPVCARP